MYIASTPPGVSSSVGTPSRPRPLFSFSRGERGEKRIKKFWRKHLKSAFSQILQSLIELDIQHFGRSLIWLDLFSLIAPHKLPRVSEPVFICEKVGSLPPPELPYLQREWPSTKGAFDWPYSGRIYSGIFQNSYSVLMSKKRLFRLQNSGPRRQ